MSQVAHLVGHHGEATAGFPGAGGLDGGVERQQVGLFGDAFDDFEDLPDVHRLAVQCLDVAAGGADLSGQFVHRGDGAFHHLATVFGQGARGGGLLRGVGGVAGDFLGGSAQFVDRGGDAVGAVGLLVGVAHGRVGGVQHQPGHLVHLMGGRGHFADGAVDTLDETVEGAGQLAEFILGMDRQAAGQVAFALGDVLHGAAHGVQRLHQHADQHAQQDHDDHHGDHGGDDSRGAELVEHAVGLALVHRYADVPVHRRQALHRGEGEDAGGAVQLDFTEAGADGRGVLRVDVPQALHHHVLVRVHQDFAVGADQEGIAHAVEVQGVDDLCQGLQAQVTAGDAEGLHRRGDGHGQLACRSVHIRLGEDGAAGALGALVPGAGTRVVALGHGAVRAHGELPVLGAEVGEGEGGAQGPLLQQGGYGIGGWIGRKGFGDAFHQQNPARKPVLDIAGGYIAHLLQIVFQVVTERIPLQVIVVQSEQREGCNYHQGGGEQNLVAEPQVFNHVCLRPIGSGTSLYRT
ncbi:hypothetical protein D9M70_296200 [compost metagenome]